jgi:hypothetical protein
MNTFLNFQEELSALDQQEIESRMQGIRRLPIQQRIMLRGLYEQWCMLYAPNYHTEQLKRRIKGSSIQLIKKLILTNY